MKSASKIATNSPRATLETGLERARLVAVPIGAVEILDVDAFRREPPHRQLGDAPGFVGRVVEHLDLEQLARIVEPAHRLDEPVGDVHLVVERKLNRDDRRRRQRGTGLRLVVRGASCRDRRGSTGASRKLRG